MASGSLATLLQFDNLGNPKWPLEFLDQDAAAAVFLPDEQPQLQTPQHREDPMEARGPNYNCIVEVSWAASP